MLPFSVDWVVIMSLTQTPYAAANSVPYRWYSFLSSKSLIRPLQSILIVSFALLLPTSHQQHQQLPPIHQQSPCPSDPPCSPCPQSTGSSSVLEGYSAPARSDYRYIAVLPHSCRVCSCPGPGNRGILVGGRGSRGRCLRGGGRLLAGRLGRMIL